VIELLLAFSRGAWAAFAVAVVLMLAFRFLSAPTGRERRRIVLVAILGTVALAAMLAVILSVPLVSELFQERASFTQEYDTGRFGRFGRHILGAELALDHPWGIGPLQFSKYFPEDPHNSFLDSFMAGGWLSGTAYLALILVTLIVGLQHVFVRTPWRTAYIAVYATFAAETGESYIIDVQHWRHYFMLIGVLWGLFAAAAVYRRAQRSERALVLREASPTLTALSPRTHRAA
jgi:multisubunit Na+/H+ antiporter MnhB subunit